MDETEVPKGSAIVIALGGDHVRLVEQLLDREWQEADKRRSQLEDQTSDKAMSLLSKQHLIEDLQAAFRGAHVAGLTPEALVGTNKETHEAFFLKFGSVVMDMMVLAATMLGVDTVRFMMEQMNNPKATLPSGESYLTILNDEVERMISGITVGITVPPSIVNSFDFGD